LKKCGCETAFDLAYDGSELLSKVEDQETFEDGRFFVKRAKEITQQTIAALNEFTVDHNTTTYETVDLGALQLERKRLEEQQLELKQKEEALTKKLIEQRAKATMQEKEKLIKKYEEALSLNVATYNELLKRYGSSSTLSVINTSKEDLLSKDNKAIVAYFIESIKELTTSYLAELNHI
jgi:hypothetical protein